MGGGGKQQRRWLRTSASNRSGGQQAWHCKWRQQTPNPKAGAHTALPEPQLCVFVAELCGRAGQSMAQGSRERGACTVMR